ncbi:hypothetical protein C2E20_7496 [Micractinium conductrix]|uniref:Uncharacterized protein n=1 Tax=Micractinium conductrix TaxID=554055 RepID=A0A2P6V4C8_9CHLO|nr:hypothetical protein C2E20_7496 [Micractinium conductrix]|eukprot:PSC68950.1 hypothetical protein C2E20_7496 [Micractinium conductrix]
MPLPKGSKAGTDKGGSKAGATSGGGGAAGGVCGLCDEAIDHEDALGYIKGTCSTCGVRCFHFECVADHVERNAKVTNSNSKCKEKGKNIARTRPQDLFAQNRTVQRKPQKCTQATCSGTMVDAELVRPQRQQAPLPEVAALPPPAKPAAPFKPAKQLQPQKAAVPARTSSDGAAAAAAAAKQQQLRTAAAAARASLAPGGSSLAARGSSSLLGTSNSGGWQAAADSYDECDRAEPETEAEPVADVAFDRQAAAAAASRLSFPRGKRPRQLQMCPKWKAGEQCLKVELGECPLCHGVDELVSREAALDQAHGGGRLQAAAAAAAPTPGASPPAAAQQEQGQQQAAREDTAAPVWGGPEPPAWGEEPAEPAAPAVPVAAAAEAGEQLAGPQGSAARWRQHAQRGGVPSPPAKRKHGAGAADKPPTPPAADGSAAPHLARPVALRHTATPGSAKRRAVAKRAFSAILKHMPAEEAAQLLSAKAFLSRF